MRSNLTDIEVHVHHRTDKAVLVSLDGNRQKGQWLPLSAVEIEMTEKNLATVTLPESLATERGLV